MPIYKLNCIHSLNKFKRYFLKNLKAFKISFKKFITEICGKRETV